MPRSSDTDA